MINAIESYLAIRRSVGFQLRVFEGLLLGFARFAAQLGQKHVVSRTAVNWAALGPTPHQRAKRLDVVRIFARHARAEDPRHEIPPEAVFPRRRPPFLPIILTHKQLNRLLVAAARLPPVNSLRPWTYCTMFSLLAVTGLRISEVLGLRLSDITPDGLVIRETKFRKNRLVPLHPSAVAGLEAYLRRRRVAGGDDHVFVSLRGRTPSYPGVNAVFLSLVRNLGLHPGPGRRGTRIHDLRHGFAVRALENCGATRKRIDQHMLALSTYMGHARLESTYWYLHATPVLLTDVADTAEAFAQGAVP
jgi:integrase/recombinase XerD